VLMRGFFVLLLLSNVLYFSWNFYISDKPDVDVLAPEMLGERLIMLSELAVNERPPLRKGQLEQTPLTTNGPEKAARTSPPNDTRCLTVRNIPDRADVDKLIELLRESGAMQIETGEEAGLRISYWVMLPAFQNRNEANAIATRLAGQQLRDFFVIRSGEHENAISLGVFSSLARAQSRQAQISALNVSGIKPEIETMQLPVRSHWVAFRVGADGVSVPEAQLQSVGELREADCP
jgi:hypothetical protein